MFGKRALFENASGAFGKEIQKCAVLCHRRPSFSRDGLSEKAHSRYCPRNMAFGKMMFYKKMFSPPHGFKKCSLFIKK